MDGDAIGLRGLGELAVLIAAYVLAVSFLPEAGVAMLQPHPLWVPVLLVTVQHGTASGLVAVLAASVASVTVGPQVQLASEDYYGYFMRVWREPILWLMAAVVLGEIRSGHIAERCSIGERLEDALRQRRILADYCDDLKAHVGALEHRIVTETAMSLREAMALMERLRDGQPATLPEDLMQAARLLLGDVRYAVVLPVRNHFEVSRQLSGDGSTGQSGTPASVFEPEWLVWKSVIRDRSVHSDLLRGTAVMAVPIVKSTGEDVLGILCVEGIDIARGAAGVTATVRCLAMELAPALQRYCSARVDGTQTRERAVLPSRRWSGAGVQ